MVFQILNYLSAILAVIVGWIPLTYLTQAENLAALASYAKFAVLVQILSVMEGAIYSQSTLVHSKRKDQISQQLIFIILFVPFVGVFTTIMSDLINLNVSMFSISIFFMLKVLETYFRGILNANNQYRFYLCANIFIKLVTLICIIYTGIRREFSVPFFINLLSILQILLVTILFKALFNDVSKIKLRLKLHVFLDVIKTNMSLGLVGLSGVLLFVIDRTILSINGKDNLLAELQLIYSLFGLFLIASATLISGILGRVYRDSDGKLTWISMIIISEFCLVGLYFFTIYIDQILNSIGILVPSDFFNDKQIVFFWGLGICFMSALQPIFYYNFHNSRKDTLVYLPFALSILYCCSSFLLVTDGYILLQVYIWCAINFIILCYNFHLFLGQVSISKLHDIRYSILILIVPLLGTVLFNIANTYTAMLVVFMLTVVISYHTSMKEFLKIIRSEDKIA